MKQLPFTALPQTRQDCITRMTQITKEINQMIKTADNKRRLELENNLQDRLAKGDKQGYRAVRNIIIAEENRKVNAQLKKLEAKENPQVSTIQVPVNEFADPKECNNWKTMFNPQEMEKCVEKRNLTHFGQAKDTFPTKPPFSELVDWQASALESDLTLKGELEDDRMQGMGKLLVEHMKATSPLNSMSATMTEEDWVGKFKSWK